MTGKDAIPGMLHHSQHRFVGLGYVRTHHHLVSQGLHRLHSWLDEAALDGVSIENYVAGIVIPVEK